MGARASPARLTQDGSGTPSLPWEAVCGINVILPARDAPINLAAPLIMWLSTPCEPRKRVSVVRCVCGRPWILIYRDIEHVRDAQRDFPCRGARSVDVAPRVTMSASCSEDILNVFTDTGKRLDSRVWRALRALPTRDVLEWMDSQQCRMGANL